MQPSNMCHVWRVVFARASALSQLPKVRPASSRRMVRARLGRYLASEQAARLVGIGFGSAATAVCGWMLWKGMICELLQSM